MADVFRDENYQHGKRHGNGGDVERRRVEFRQAHPRGGIDGRHGVISEVASQRSEDPADDHAEQDGQARDHTAAGDGGQQDNEQCHGGHERLGGEVLGRIRR